jgi:hypothetical protein
MIHSETDLINRVDELLTSRARLALVVGMLMGTMHNLKRVLKDYGREAGIGEPLVETMLSVINDRMEDIFPIVHQEFYPERIQSASEIITEAFEKKKAP